MGFEFGDGGGSKSDSTHIGISDSVGGSQQSSSSYSKSKSSSRPSTPVELAAYYDELDRLTGGRVSGVAGSPYSPLSADEIRRLGGLGATREAKALAARERALAEIEADPTLTLFQRNRARQLAESDFRGTMDSIAGETGASITTLARQNALDEIEAELAQVELLADIFYGGKGQRSKSSSESRSTSQGTSHQESHSTSFGDSTSTSDGGDSFGVKLA